MLVLAEPAVNPDTDGCDIAPTCMQHIKPWCVNPLSPNSDQQQFSPNNIHALSRDEVMRFNKDYQRENALILH